MADIIAAEDAHTSGAYPKREIALVRGEGARVWDADGREYIDCNAGHGVANVGHCHPAITEAIQAQAGILVTCSETFYNDQRAVLINELTARTPGNLDRVFLCNSGTEAVEGALKIARYFTGRTGIVAAMRGFHGRTLGALSLTWDKKYREPFMPLLPDVSHVPYDKLEAMDEAVGDNTAAVLVEAVQGEGGVRPGSAEYLAGLRRLCSERGALLIVDEVQSGFGRTGRWFACEYFDLVPDVLCLGKAIGGGIPMGAVVWRETLGQLKPGIHGSTFGGNALACAASRAVLRVLGEESLPERAARIGETLLDNLQGIDSPLIREVRGLGLMIGIELKQKSTPVLKEMMDRGVLALPAGPNVVRLLPPLVIGEDDLETVVQVIRESLDAYPG
ncbi:MAG: aspartate aminotransferase family protein [Anaerolineae bacterium]|nr:aspartate aminotransferase family protein [Anaerolineae bacterium]